MITNTKYSIKQTDCPDRAVNAYAIGIWGIHEEEKGQYNISHIPSGYALIFLSNFKAAREFIRILNITKFRVSWENYKIVYARDYKKNFPRLRRIYLQVMEKFGEVYHIKNENDVGNWAGEGKRKKKKRRDR